MDGRDPSGAQQPPGTGKGPATHTDTEKQSFNGNSPSHLELGRDQGGSGAAARVGGEAPSDPGNTRGDVGNGSKEQHHSRWSKVKDSIQGSHNPGLQREGSAHASNQRLAHLMGLFTPTGAPEAGVAPGNGAVGGDEGEDRRDSTSAGQRKTVGFAPSHTALSPSGDNNIEKIEKNKVNENGSSRGGSMDELSSLRVETADKENKENTAGAKNKVADDSSSVRTRDSVSTSGGSISRAKRSTLHRRVTSTDVLHMRKESQPVIERNMSISAALNKSMQSQKSIHENIIPVPGSNRQSTTSRKSTDKISLKKPKTSPMGEWWKALKYTLNPPGWFMSNLKNKVKLKDVFRAWCACFTMLVLVLVPRTLFAIGNVSFFGLVVAMMIPPEGSFPAVGRKLVLFLLFVAIGWSWSLLAMLSALNVRGSAASDMNIIASESSSPQDFETHYSLAIFEGVFLDSKSSAIYGVFMFIGNFIMGFLRSMISNNLIMMPTVFGSVMIDVGCSIGPLFPKFTSALGINFLIPTLCYVAVALVSMVVIFPRSASYSFSVVIQDGLATVKKIIKLQQETLVGDFDHKRIEELLKSTVDERGKWAGLLSNLHMIRPLLKYDIYRGYFSPMDYEIIQDAIFVIGARLIGLCSAQRMFEGIVAFEPEDEGDEKEELKVYYSEANNIESDYIQEEFNPLPGPDFNRLLNTPEDISIMSDMLALINEITSDLFTACFEGMDIVTEVIQEAESKRYFGKLNGEEIHKRLLECRDKLEKTIHDFQHSRWNKVMEPYSGHFDELGNPLDFAIDLNYKPLFLSLVLIASLPQTGESIVKLLNLMMTTLTTSPVKHTFSPLKSVIDHTKVRPTVIIDDEVEKLQKNDVIFFQTKKKYEPETVWAKYLLKPIYILHKVVVSPYGVYAFRYAILSLLMWLPSVFPASAKFYYENRGLWAIIMAQTGLTVFAGEQLINVFNRIIASCFGLVIGVICWYIGAGDGAGSPYGIAAVMAVVLIPIMMFRLWYPQIVVAILLGVTVVLIVGYSYVNTHIKSVLNPGHGITIGIKRFLTLIIGLGSSFIMMLIPSPKSFLHHIQQRHATILGSLANLIGKIIEVSRIKDEDERNTKFSAITRYLFAMNLEAKSLLQITPMARTEPQVFGPFSVTKYSQLCKIEVQIIESLIQLVLTLRAVGNDLWYDRVVNTGFFKDYSIAQDILVTLKLMSNSFANRKPVPNVIPTTFGNNQHEFAGILQFKTMHITSMKWSDINSFAFPAFSAGMVSTFHIIILVKRLQQAVIDVLDEENLLDFTGYQPVKGSLLEEDVVNMYEQYASSPGSPMYDNLGGGPPTEDYQGNTYTAINVEDDSENTKQEEGLSEKVLPKRDVPVPRDDYDSSAFAHRKSSSELHRSQSLPPQHHHDISNDESVNVESLHVNQARPEKINTGARPASYASLKTPQIAVIGVSEKDLEPTRRHDYSPRNTSPVQEFSSRRQSLQPHDGPRYRGNADYDTIAVNGDSYTGPRSSYSGGRNSGIFSTYNEGRTNMSGGHMSIGGMSTNSSINSRTPEEIDFLTRNPGLGRLGRDALRFAMAAESGGYPGLYHNHHHTTGNLPPMANTQQGGNRGSRGRDGVGSNNSLNQQHRLTALNATYAGNNNFLGVNTHLGHGAIPPNINTQYSVQSTATSSRRSRSHQRLHNVYNSSTVRSNSNNNN